MALEVEWTTTAKGDFKKILNYIAKDSVVNTQRVAEKIRKKIELIRGHPGVGHHATAYKSERVRQVTVFSYRIIYELIANRLIIKRIVHGARLFPKQRVE